MTRRQPGPPEDIDVPGYRGPERRSGVHSPYGNGLFGIMREVQADQERIRVAIEALVAQDVSRATMKVKENE